MKDKRLDYMTLEILPNLSDSKILLWETALKCGLGGVEPASTTPGHSGEIAFTCAPAADSVLTSGGQSEGQAVIQQFPYNLLLYYNKCLIATSKIRFIGVGRKMLGCF